VGVEFNDKEAEVKATGVVVIGGVGSVLE